MAKRKRRQKSLKLPIWLSVIIAILVAAYLIMDYMGYSIQDLFRPKREPVDGQITVHIIDVGQADSILIETPDGYMLIDAGRSKQGNNSQDKNPTADDLENYLRELGVTEIEYFVITHAHDDHDGFADMIFEKFKVKNLIYDDFGYTDKKKEMFDEGGANIIDPEVRDKYYLGEAEFTVISSDISETRSDKNDHSIVLRLDYGESSFIFAGDATTYTENIILEEFTTYELDCDFLKSGHHGSTTSSGKKFIDALTPDVVAVSVGMNNDHNLPKQEVLDRYEDAGAEVHRTDLSGSLVYVCDGKTIVLQENN